MVLPNPLTSAKTVSCFFNNAWREGRREKEGGGEKENLSVFITERQR